MVSVTHLILRFAIVCFQQTNKNKINLINDSHIKFEVSLHLGGIWPTVCQSKLRKKSRILLPSASLTKFEKKILKKMGESVIKALELWNMDNNDNFYGKEYFDEQLHCKDVSSAR